MSTDSNVTLCSLNLTPSVLVVHSWGDGVDCIKCLKVGGRPIPQPENEDILDLFEPETK